MKKIENWEELAIILKKYGYKKEMIKKIKESKALPPTYKIYEINRLFGVPFEAWEPLVTSFLNRKNKKEPSKPSK